MSRHLEEVATSTLNQKLSRHQLAKKLRLRQHSVVMTSVAKSKAVATSAYKETRSRHHSEVATSSAKERTSRHHSVVATSAALKRGRDIIKRSRHQLRRLEVATLVSSCDNRSKERRSRHHSVVATSVALKRGRDIIQWSPHPLQRPEGRDIVQ